MMRQRMIASLLAVVVLAASLSLFAFCNEATSNIILSVRMKVDNCVAALPNWPRGCPSYMREFGMPSELKLPENELGMSVSNSIDVVYTNFSVLATNVVERRLLLASAWRLGDGFYLDCLSRNVDLAIAGVITAEDLEWYMRGHRTRRLTYMLAAQYDKPGVSNIVLRLMADTRETNKYEKVLSGEAKTEYLELEQFMADGPESPLKGN